MNLAMAGHPRQALATGLLKELCASGGSLGQGELCRRQGLQDKPELLDQLLQDRSKFARVAREEAPSAEEGVVVVATTGARLCREHGSGGKCAGGCRQLHLCRYFVYGGCRHEGTRKQCKFIHDFHTPHNLTVLKEHELENLNSAELCQLLLQNDPSLLPEICTYYNKGDGPHGSCNFKKICVKLHICQYYLQGECRFGSSCKRSHDVFNPDCYDKLEKWGMSQALISRIPLIYRNVYDIKNSTPSPHRDKCIRVHFHLPYKWQISDGAQWKDLDNMEKIEQAYCDPFHERITCKSAGKDSKLVIDFSNMTYGSAKLRRLSTASSVTKAPHYILTTDWIWYWKDEYDIWNEYGIQDADHAAATVSSYDLEKAYQSEASPTLKFSAGRHEYVIDFRAMKQKNVRYHTERSICRRPKFVSLKEVEQKKKTGGTEQLKGSTTLIPAHWDQSALPELGYALITLLPSSSEYKKIQVNFQRTMPKATIIQIKRIQNRSLWEVYQWQKEQMKKANEGKTVDERQLFHGTNKSHVDAICQQNFDWRICGVHGTAYGKGSYFARDASYSDNYSKSDSTIKTMFLARVLVGEFTYGLSSYLRPPPKEKQNTLFYNSCVNDLLNPSIFVIFEKHQIYPEYVIEYRP
ncbi:hypothetical protein JD844_028540 [Phrynosoma platyrhinos]|uniref:Poly [ADP-ribose] polymerase 12 n=1 Tax=Phrynosoma platyrhinos TaxID=52577 RepID=A0ABQ7SI21_PHRPL|nr:hypothetical protein JD844_028540 [Phrynosoma platyrhinos]